MNKKLIFTLVGIVILGLVAMGAYVYFNINESNQAETVEQTDEPQIKPAEQTKTKTKPSKEPLVSGRFKDGDAVHKGKGTAEIVKTNGENRLVFKDFKVTKGPDVFVYLSPNAADEDLGKFASLGKIKSSEGDQSYSLPENYQDYKTVVIWCRAFGVTFATAELK